MNIRCLLLSITCLLTACGGGGGGAPTPAPPPPPQAVTITITDSIAAEGDSGTSTLTFAVTLSAVANANVTVDYQTADGTATSSADYQQASGTATITAGATTANINVVVIGDILYSDDDPTETFTVTLSNPSGAVLSGKSTGTGTINNDDLSRQESYDQLFADFQAFETNEVVPLAVPGSGVHVETINVDLDDDNDLDVVVGVALGDDATIEELVTGEIYIFRNYLGGGFVGEGSGINGHFRDAITGDFNRDGREDVYFAQHGFDFPPFPGHQDLLLLQTASGQLTDATASNLPAFLDFSHGACSADFDSNGGLDIVTANIFSFKMLMNDGNGTFANETAARFPIIPLSAEAVADAGLEAGIPPDELQFLGHSWAWCTAFDADLLNGPDVILGGVNPDGMRTYDGDDLAHKHVLLLNDGTGNLVYDSATSRIQKTPFTVSTAVGFASMMLNADFNNDGCIDFAAAGTDDDPSDGSVDDVLDFFINDCSGQFSIVFTYSHDSWISINSAIEDLNGDGIDEYIIFGSSDAADLFVYENNSGTITQRPLTLQDTYHMTPSSFIETRRAF